MFWFTFFFLWFKIEYSNIRINSERCQVPVLQAFRGSGHFLWCCKAVGEHLLEVDKADRKREEIILKELIYV